MKREQKLKEKTDKKQGNKTQGKKIIQKARRKE